MFFPLLFFELAEILAPKLSMNFHRLLLEGLFTSNWRCADIATIPKGPIFSLLSGSRPISIAPVLSKVFERLISVRLGRFMERSGVFPEHQCFYCKGLGTCDALLDIVCAGQAALYRCSELALIQIDIVVQHFIVITFLVFCLSCNLLELVVKSLMINSLFSV